MSEGWGRRAYVNHCWEIIDILFSLCGISPGIGEKVELLLVLFI